MSLIPYLLAAAYAVKVASSDQSFGTSVGRSRALTIGCLATLYTLFLVYAAGPEFLLLSCIIYAPGTILYLMARRENNARVFTTLEAIVCAALATGAIAGVVALATGAISI